MVKFNRKAMRYWQMIGVQERPPLKVTIKAPARKRKRK